jgi:hypothetical protein
MALSRRDSDTSGGSVAFVLVWRPSNLARLIQEAELRACRSAPPEPNVNAEVRALAVTPGTATVVSVDVGAVSEFTLPKVRPLSWRLEFTFATSVDDVFRGWQGSHKDASEPDRYVDGELVA